MPLLKDLGSFISKLRFESLPENVRKKAKIHVLDAIACGVAGYELKFHQPLVDILKEYTSKPESTVIFEGWKTSCLDAAFINAFIINAADIEDTHRFSITHPAAPVIGSALAIGERERIDGKMFLTSVVAGYEVMARVGMAINPSAYLRGFHATSVCAPFASATVASKILGLDEELTTDALAIAAIQASGLLEAFSEKESKGIQVARGAYSGVLAALLAHKGLKGSQTIMEGGQFYKSGYLSAFSDEPKPEALHRGLGDEFEITKTAIKIHGGCRYIHSPMDTALEIVRKYNINVKNIKRIRVRYTSQAHNLEIAEPKDEKQAIFNTAFGIALLLLRGDASFHAFTRENLRDPKIAEFMKKITTEVDPKLDEKYTKTGFGTIVTIETKDGKVFEEERAFPRGEPEWPVTEDEVLEKVRRLTYRALGREKAEELISIVLKLEEVKDISDFIAKTIIK
jgi:2-methylcitrate dehydratase PrpD